jgi:Spy/CpxP family protein refolding chaperone
MRRFFGITMPVLALCLLVGNVAMAQGRGGRGGFGGGMFQMGPAQLLGFAQVQKELKMTDDQTAKVKEILDAARPPRGGNGGVNFREMTEEQRTAFFAEARKKSDEAGKKASELLTAEQNTRLKQIELWVQGTSALVQNAELAKQLNLTDDQKGAIKTINDESAKKIGELRQSAGRGASDEDRAKVREQTTALRTESDAECMAVLTDDQKAQFEKMKGPKFQLDYSQLGPPRGRGGNN